MGEPRCIGPKDNQRRVSIHVALFKALQGGA